MRSDQYLYEDKAQFQQLLFDKNISDSPSLLFQVFAGDPDLNKTRELLSILNNSFPLSTIIGSTSGKETIGTALNKGSIVVAVTRFEKTRLVSASFSLSENQLKTEDSKQLGSKVGKLLKENRAAVAISFLSVLKGEFNCEDFLDEIYRISPDTCIAGGYSGVYHMHRPENYYTIHNGNLSTMSCVVVALISDDLKVSNHFSMEWIPIGKGMEITSAVGNRIYSLDNIPTFDIYTEYLGPHIESGKKYAGLIFPLFIERSGVKLVRTASKFHDDKSISYPANFKNGDKVFFGVANPSSFQESIENSYAAIAKWQPEAIFCYSCMARDSFLPLERIKEETRIIGKLAAHCGFQTMGEFYHSKNGNFVMNYTSTFLLLKEGEKNATVHDTIIEEYEDVHNFEENFELKTLTHLLEITSKQLKESNQKFKKLAIYDSLTQIYNRGKIEQTMKRELEKCNRKMEKTFSLFLFDLDDFKRINDRYGHNSGDLVLKRVTSEVSSSLRQIDYFGRWGGEEFMIILPSTSLIEAKHMMDRITLKISSIIFEEDFNITISGGLTEYTVGISFEEMMKSVDKKLYKAKRSGKNTVLY